MKIAKPFRAALTALSLSMFTLTAGCAAPMDEEIDGEASGESDRDDEDGDVGTTSEALSAGQCSVSVMKPRIGSTGVSAASNATGYCNRAPGSTLYSDAHQDALGLADEVGLYAERPGQRRLQPRRSSGLARWDERDLRSGDRMLEAGQQPPLPLGQQDLEAQLLRHFGRRGNTRDRERRLLDGDRGIIDPMRKVRVTTWNVLHRVHASNWGEPAVKAFPDERVRAAAIAAKVERWLRDEDAVVCLQEVSGDLLATLRAARWGSVGLHDHRYPRVPRVRGEDAVALDDVHEHLVILAQSPFTPRVAADVRAIPAGLLAVTLEGRSPSSTPT